MTDSDLQANDAPPPATPVEANEDSPKQDDINAVQPILSLTPSMHGLRASLTLGRIVVFRHVVSVLLFAVLASFARADGVTSNTLTFKDPRVIEWNKSIENGRVSMAKSKQPMILLLGS